MIVDISYERQRRIKGRNKNCHFFKISGLGQILNFLHRKLKPLRNILILFFIILMISIPQSAFAHAILEKAVPAPDSQIQSSPKEIVLMFNERLENELYSIKVFNNRGEEISKSNTKLSVNQKQLIKSLPNLSNGNYTISYSVISADGHPLKDSYLFSVGEVSGEKSENTILQQDSTERQESFLESTVRIFYFITLLLVTGWILWGTITRKRLVEKEELRSIYQKWTIYLQCTFLLANIGMGAIQVLGLLDNWDLNQLFALLTGTTVGITWFISMILSFLGFLFLNRHPWLDRGWLFLMLVTESVNGHAFVYDPPLLTVSINLIHLLAAAIWAGGLLYILIYWNKQREHVRHFLVIFSKTALVCMILLIVTGLTSTLIYLPELHYLFFSRWGFFLQVKMVLVLLVIAVGGTLRIYIKKNSDGNIGKMVKVDFVLMIAIVCIVGIFTHLSPLPENKPLKWYENRNKVEFTATISPKVPGTNMFMVEANSKEEGLNIKRIELLLIYKDNSDVAPIRVPFTEYKQANKVHYMIDGQYLPFAGNWTVQIRILDSEDNERVYRKDFIVY